jgi:hypothetical protein
VEEKKGLSQTAPLSMGGTWPLTVLATAGKLPVLEDVWALRWRDEPKANPIQP